MAERIRLKKEKQRLEKLEREKIEREKLEAERKEASKKEVVSEPKSEIKKKEPVLAKKKPEPKDKKKANQWDEEETTQLKFKPVTQAKKDAKQDAKQGGYIKKNNFNPNYNKNKLNKSRNQQNFKTKDHYNSNYNKNNQSAHRGNKNYNRPFRNNYPNNFGNNKPNPNFNNMNGMRNPMSMQNPMAMSNPMGMNMIPKFNMMGNMGMPNMQQMQYMQNNFYNNRNQIYGSPGNFGMGFSNHYMGNSGYAIYQGNNQRGMVNPMNQAMTGGVKESGNYSKNYDESKASVVFKKNEVAKKVTQSKKEEEVKAEVEQKKNEAEVEKKQEETQVKPEVEKKEEPKVTENDSKPEIEEVLSPKKEPEPEKQIEEPEEKSSPIKAPEPSLVESIVISNDPPKQEEPQPEKTQEDQKANAEIQEEPQKPEVSQPESSSESSSSSDEDEPEQETQTEQTETEKPAAQPQTTETKDPETEKAEKLRQLSNNYQVVVYLEDEIENFLESYRGEIDNQFKHLVREFRAETVKAGGNRDRNYNRRGRGRGGKHGRDRDRNRDRWDKKRDRDNYGKSSYRRKEYSPPKEDKPMLKRQEVDPEKLKWLREQKESVGDWLIDKQAESEEQKVRKEIKGMLNKMTMDSLSELKPKLVKLAKEQDLAEFMCDELVKKAWKEIKYRNCYSQVVKAIISKSYKWEQAMEAAKQEKLEETSKKTKKSKFKPSYLKKRILKKLENEYSNGFKNYQEFRKTTNADEKLTKEDKVDKILKKRDALYGNVLFMSELFNKGVVSVNTLKTIVSQGLISIVQSFCDLKTETNPEAQKETKAIFIDYVEALLKFWEEAGKQYEIKQDEQFKKQSKKLKDNKKVKNQLNREIDLEIADKLISFMKTEKFGWDKNVKNDKQMRAKFFCIFDMLEVFVKVVEHIQKQDLDVRMDSLIENFLHLKRTGWKRIFTRQKASESKKDVDKKLQQEQEEEERLMYQNRKNRDYRRRDRGNRRRERYYDDEDDYGYDDYGYDDYEDDYRYQRRDNKDAFRKKGGRKEKYTEVKKQKKFKKAAVRFDECEKFLTESYKNKTWDGEKFGKIWEMTAENAQDQPEMIAKYLLLIMRNCKDSDFDDRLNVFRKWVEDGAVNADHFEKGFTMSVNKLVDEVSDSPKIFKAIFYMIILLIEKFDFTLDSVKIEYMDGDEKMDAFDAEDVFYFYDTLVTKCLGLLDEVEDADLKENLKGMLERLIQRAKDNMPKE